MRIFKSDARRAQLSLRQLMLADHADLFFFNKLNRKQRRQESRKLRREKSISDVLSRNENKADKSAGLCVMNDKKYKNPAHVERRGARGSLFWWYMG